MSKKFLIAPLAFMMFIACSSEQENDNKEATSTTQPPKMTEGKKLFVNNCLVCHSIEKDKTGPALAGVIERWDNDTARVKAFIHNPAKMIAERDKRAVEIYEKWNHTQMTPFPNLTDKQLDAILEYITKGEE